MSVLSKKLSKFIIKILDLKDINDNKKLWATVSQTSIF